MRHTLIAAWPLFFGVVMIMTGNGLQGTLLGIRASEENFSIMVTGFIMSLYYGGYMAGSILVPQFIKDVGHIRVFAAMASIGSTSVLLHGVFVDPVFWALARAITGFCYAGLYITIESWFNGISTKETRGRIISVYFFALYAAMVMGQFLLTLAPPTEIDLFILTSVLVSMSLVPIVLSKRTAPEIKTPKRLGLGELIKISPLGVVGVFISGLGSSTMFTIGPVYAMQSGFSVTQVATYMTAIIAGGLCGQIPVGYMSDKFGRRPTILLLSVLIIVFSLVASLHLDNVIFFYGALFVWGGAMLAVYSTAMAHTNDHVDPDQYINASASLILINGIGAFAGPFVVTIAMQVFGDFAYYGSVALIYTIFFLLTIWRTIVRDAVPREDQVHQLNIPQRATPYAARFIKNQWVNKDIANDTPDKTPPSDK